jgi:hypothetical protein
MAMIGLITASIGEWQAFVFVHIYIPFILRFADRDMVMRYHWGLGIGHVYSHSQAPNRDASTMASAESNSRYPSDNSELEPEANNTVENILDPTVMVTLQEDGNDSDVDNPELGFEDLDDDLGDAEVSEGEADDEIDDELLLAMDEMYGSDGYND